MDDREFTMRLRHVKSLAKHTAVYGMGDLLGKATGILLVPVYARLLSPSENGDMALAYAFVSFSVLLYALGLNHALVRHLSVERGAAGIRLKFSTAYWTLLVVGVVLSVLVWTSAARLAVFFLNSTSYADIFRTIAVILLLDTLSEPFFTLCRVRQRSGIYAAVRFVQHTLQLGLTVYLIAWEGHGVRAIFWSNLASSTFAFLALCPVGFRELRPVYSHAILRELLHFGLPFVPSAAALLLINLSDRLLLKFFIGKDPVGVLQILFRFCLPMQMLTRVFRAAWAPGVLAIPDRTEARNVVARMTTYFAAGATLLLLVLSAFARDLILLGCGDRAADYLPAQGVIPIVTLAFLLSGIYIILTAGVYAEGRSRMLPFIVALGAGINVGLNLLLIPRMGVLGAAWSTLAAYGVMVVFLYLHTRRFYPVAYEYARLAKVAVAGGIVFLVVSGNVSDASPSGVVTRCILLLAYPFVLWGWNFLETGEWQEIRQLFRLSTPASVERDPTSGSKP